MKFLQTNIITSSLSASLVGLMLAAGIANAATYELDPHHTNAQFAIQHFGMSTVRGGFYNIIGTLQMDASAKTGAIDVTIPIATLNTGNQQFTDHLLGSDFFDVANNKSISFKSDKFNFDDGKVSSIDGKLTMNGVTKPITLKAENFACMKHPVEKVDACGGDFEVTIMRSDFGIDLYADVPMMDETELTIQVEALKK